MTEAQPSVAANTEQQQHVHSVPVAAAPDANYMQQQIFLLEDTVMTMSMAVTTISQAMRRWEKILLPMMAGFILLAGYGFYLIYHLTYDIGMMSNNMAQMTMTVDKNMTVIAQELRGIQKEVRTMTGEVVTIDDHLTQMNDSMLRINENMNQMVISTNRMGTDLWDLNRSISGPMSTINNIAPWRMMGGRKEPPPPPQAVPQSSYPYYYGLPAPQPAPAQQPAQTETQSAH
jgi:hypothetical protein